MKDYSSLEGQEIKNFVTHYPSPYHYGPDHEWDSLQIDLVDGRTIWVYPVGSKLIGINVT